MNLEKTDMKGVVHCYCYYNLCCYVAMSLCTTGGLPNGKLQVSLRLEDDVLSAEVIKTHGLWNFYPPGGGC